MDFFPRSTSKCLCQRGNFFIAIAEGKPLTVDMATRNQTRPSCAKIKIEVDLTDTLQQRMRIMKEDDVTGNIKFRWVKVQYDYMPKYRKDVDYKVITSRVAGQYTQSCMNLRWRWRRKVKVP